MDSSRENPNTSGFPPYSPVGFFLWISMGRAASKPAHEVLLEPGWVPAAFSAVLRRRQPLGFTRLRGVSGQKAPALNSEAPPLLFFPPTKQSPALPRLLGSLPPHPERRALAPQPQPSAPAAGKSRG